MTSDPKDFYLPQTNIHEMIHFKVGDESTYTASRFVNHFLRLYLTKPEPEQEIAKRMGLTPLHFKALLKVEAGTTYREFRDYWMVKHIAQEIRSNPKMRGDGLAEKLGFKSRTGLWYFYTSKRYKRIAEEIGGIIFREPEHQMHH